MGVRLRIGTDVIEVTLTNQAVEPRFERPDLRFDVARFSLEWLGWRALEGFPILSVRVDDARADAKLERLLRVEFGILQVEFVDRARFGDHLRRGGKACPRRLQRPG